LNKAEKEENKVQKEKEQQNAVSTMGLDDGDVVGESAEHSCNIVRVCHRIKVELDGNEVNSKGGRDEVWALIEFESYNPDQPEPMLVPPRRTKKWKRFEAESDLSDFIRRDTGEPLSLPPPSLSVQQSQKIQESAKQSVSQITEEFRRYRVKAEMTRKQQDSQIRELQRCNAETAKRRIQGNDAVSIVMLTCE
jgi:hypothetical protein